MPSVEERLATLEGRMQEQATFMADVRGSVVEMIRELRREIDQRFQQVDQRFQQVDRRFDAIDRRFDRVDRYFLWMLGAIMTVFAAMMAALIGGVFRLT